MTMNDLDIAHVPAALDAIGRDAEAIGFSMASEPRTGALLRAMVASKPGGRFLELGTGTGVGTAWLLAGMDASARLDTVESDGAVLDVARRHLGQDPRVTFHHADAPAFLEQAAATPAPPFDLIYADTWAGKFTHRDLALSLLRVGGIYFIDDLSPQPNWPEDHAPKVPALIADLEGRPGFTSTRLAWASGLLLLVRTHA
jgi:predicted O-methyltransferase YrrM